jgi:hypothetical protein
MPKTYHAFYVSVLDALKAHGCIESYAIEGYGVRFEWKEGGFARAFTEFKARPHTPFGLKKKGEAATFLLVLTMKEDAKKTVDDYLMSEFKVRYDLK